MSVFQTTGWHEGEDKIHDLMNVRNQDNPQSPFLTPRAANLVQRYSLLALGSTDAEDNIWCTIWGGEPPFIQPVARSILGVRTTVDVTHDPVIQALFRGKDDGEVIKPPAPGPMIGALSIHLEERGRVKLYGRMVAGALSAHDPQTDGPVPDGGRSGEVQLVFKVDGSMGNCPKYLNRKFIKSHKPSSKLLSQSPHLSKEALEIVHQADLFFIASAHEHEDMDCNHRGGPPGFLRVHEPSDLSKGTELVWPEYSGNNLYQTLGNLMATPKAGIVIPNFETGDVLYLSGETDVLVHKDASNLIAKSKLAVRFKVQAARLVQNGLPFRGTLVEDDAKGRSPYNPRIRYLTTEHSDEFGQDDAPVKAKLIKKTIITPTINRYRFALEDAKVLGPQKAGQYVALDFNAELDMGYSHMRDDDPTSLNDDYLRTFTVSSAPQSLGLHGEEFEVTIRQVGSVTKWLSWQREGLSEVGVKGFGGEFTFDQSDGKTVGFVAAGIGITPLLGLVNDIAVEKLKVFWTVSIRDVGLLLDVMKQYPQFKERMTIFLTGKDGILNDELSHKQLKEVLEQKWKVIRRRLAKDDLTVKDSSIDQWYTCTAPPMRKEIQDWLPGKSIIYENFDY